MPKLIFNKLKSTDAIWIPQVPEHWELVKVRHLFKESTRKGFPDETLLVASQEHGVVSKDTYGKRTVEATKDLQNLKLVEQGDFVISLRSFQGGIELAHVRGIISSAYTIMKETRQIEKRYFKNLFKSPPFISLMTLCVKGIREGQNIDYPTFKNEYLPFPPLEEQKAISAYLDKKNNKIDKFIRNKERLIELLEEQKNGIINQTILKGLNPDVKVKESGIDWINKIPNNWVVKKLRYLGGFQNGVSAGAEYFGTGFPFISYGDVYNNVALPTEITNLAKSTKEDRIRYSIIEGDVFFTRTSETIEEIGFSSVCLETIVNANFSGFLIRFRPKSNLLFKGYSKYYFRSNLHRRYFVKEMNLVTRASLSQDLLKNLLVILPSIDEQKEIANYLDAKMNEINLAISKAQKEISSIKEYREALITDLVTGKRSVPQLQMS
jgi:type I restriction enzyme S subunit